MKVHSAIHQDLLAIKTAYEAVNVTCEDILPEEESKEYGAYVFKINRKIVRFRVAKITPTKVGQFVTFWKRSPGGPIEPYDATDMFDLLIVIVREAERCGQFIFPKAVLVQNGLLSKDGCGGKRAMRVYPPWVITENLQARKTQEWQSLYFYEIAPAFNGSGIQKLFAITAS